MSQPRETGVDGDERGNKVMRKNEGTECCKR